MYQDRSYRRPARFEEMGGALDVLSSSLSDAVETFFDSIGPGSSPRSMRPLPRHGGSPGRHHRDCDCDQWPGHEHHEGHEHGHRRDDHGCPDCGPESCHCRCCIGDADLLVYSRLYEVRVVPIRIENRRKRAREISLALSGFHGSGGRDVPIQGVIASPTEFTLEPCSSENVTILVAARGAKADDEAGMLSDFGAVAERAADERKIFDVDDCVVGYAHLQVDGCDVRPVRIAVALLPRECGGYQLECNCSCC